MSDRCEPDSRTRLERVADETPQQLLALEESMLTEHWRWLASGASVALAAMGAGRTNGLSSRS